VTRYNAVPSCLASLCHTHFSVILLLVLPNFVIRKLFRKNVLRVGHACYMFRQFPATIISCVNNIWRTQSWSCSLCRIFHPLRPKHSPPPSNILTLCQPHKTTRSQFTCDLLSPLTVSEVCCRPGRSWLIWTSPYWSPALARTDRVSRYLLDRRQVNITELLAYIRLPFSLDCAVEPRTHVSGFSFLEFIVFEWQTSFVSVGMCSGLEAKKILFNPVFVFVIKILVNLKNR